MIEPSLAPSDGPVPVRQRAKPKAMAARLWVHGRSGVYCFVPAEVSLQKGLTLSWRWIGEQDGWSDDPDDPPYNRPVRLPQPFSAEALIRDDPLYDVIVVLGHNEAPPAPGKGSAIFFHVLNEGKSTEGCMAIAMDEMDGIGGVKAG